MTNTFVKNDIDHAHLADLKNFSEYFKFAKNHDLAAELRGSKPYKN